MWWTEPYWLIALILIIPVLIWGHESKPGMGKFDDEAVKQNSKGKEPLRQLLLLRLTAIVAIAMALAGLSILLPSRHRSVVILLDVSGSIDRYEIEREREKALRWIARLRPEDRVAVLSFAGSTRRITSLITPVEAIRQLESAELKTDGRDRTNLQASLKSGYALLEGVYGNRAIILFSDGRPNAGSLESAEPSLRGDVKIYVVPMGRVGRGLFTKALVLPKHLRQEEAGTMAWQIVNDRKQNVTVSVKVDGRIVAEKRLDIAVGTRTIPLELPPLKTGLHRVEIQVAGEYGRRIPQAEGGGLLNIGGIAQILVIHGESPTSPVARALAVQGLQVRDTGLAEIQEEMGGLNRYSAVVLDNVAATDMTSKQHRAFQSYVADGGGLLVIGGDRSLGLGEYYDTSMENLLPVRTDTRQRLRFTRANILFIIDHSGSMSDQVGKVSKQLAAMKGIVAAAEGLNPMDEVGILTFSSRTSWVLPFTKVANKQAIEKALDRLDAGGGTEMVDALDEAARGLAGRGPVGKHVILLTDGITGPERMRAICNKLKAIGATITTIGVGEDVNETLLRSIARWGLGHYYRAKADQIPKVIVKETVRVTRELVNEGEFKPKIRELSGMVDGLTEPLPPVKGYLLTKAKGLAEVVLTIGNKPDPLLAVWRYGSGRVAVFTGDSGERWLAGWSGTPVYNQFWAQVVRSLERVSIDQGLRLSTRSEAGRIRVTVEAIGEDLRLKTGLQLVGKSGENPGEYFRMTEHAPGFYEAVIPFEGSGLQEIEVRDAQSGTWAATGIWNVPGKEYQSLGPDRALLGYLSGLSGGGLLSISDPKLPEVGLSWVPVSLRFYLILLGLIIFLIEMAIRSTSLGQFAMFRAAMTVWREVQSRLIAVARGNFETVREENIIQNARQLVETNRFLAERRRRK